MPWLIGIDEAGYGPNLGPLVMSAVPCWIPPEHETANLWQLFQPAVRRHDEPTDDRLLIDDSKLVYSSGRGLNHLERAVFALLPPLANGCTLGRLIELLAHGHHAELGRECWYRGRTALPLEADAALLGCPPLEQLCRDHGLRWGYPRVFLVCPPRFNQCLQRHGSKAAILALGLGELLRHFLQEEDGESVHFFIDKHGGRNHYGSMLQEGCEAGLVAVAEEGPECSMYQVLGLGRHVQVTIRPRADAHHPCVALASMVSKYLREVLMLEFNRFWQTQLPGLKATAGYPVDATRFVQDIRPLLADLGIAESDLWRDK